ncbi:MAG: TRL-like family protein [Leptospira sp.]|nr:TRL-like family protein [Leptospira sp.]
MIALPLLNCMGNYTSSPHSPILFSKTSQNINETFSSGDFHYRIGNASILKKGKACYKSVPILNYLIYDSEDRTIEKAMKDGGITKVAIVDRESMYFLVTYTIFSKECIVVYGE